MAEDEQGTLLSMTGLCLEGRFEIARRIGAGSYAEIYLARNVAPRDGEPGVVVVKALNPLLHGDLEPDLERTLLENIALEGQTLRNFDHPNIVSLYACGAASAHDGRQFHYLILEHMPGGSLSQLCGGRPLTFEQTLAYTKQICSALACAHARGVLHRDVKPNNIMLSLDRRVAKLLDFGTARLMGTAGSITRVGTDLYAAPEHYSLSDFTEDGLTPAADVYALAKTFYYMLCGRSPSSFKQRQISWLPPNVADQTWAGSVLAVLRRATSARPEQRQQSVHDFLAELSAASDMTVLSPRRGSAARVFDRNESRFVIEVVAEPPRDYMRRLAETCVHVAKRTLGSASTVAAGAWAACVWLRPRLRGASRVAAALGRRSISRLGTLPYSLTAKVGAIVMITLLMLVATPHVLRWWRAPSAAAVENTGTGTLGGGQATANTDINIRSGPSGRTLKIGLAERGSRVNVLSTSEDQRWCYIEVMQHGRGKADPASADRGWVGKRYLTFD
jgi:hypothetical protein